MAKVQVIIDFDPATGVSNLNGPLENVVLMDHLLKQGARLYEGWLAARKQEPRKVLPVTSIEGLIKPNGHPR